MAILDFVEKIHTNSSWQRENTDLKVLDIMDLVKAFDTVNFSIRWIKLEHYGTRSEEYHSMTYGLRITYNVSQSIDWEITKK